MPCILRGVCHVCHLHLSESGECLVLLCWRLLGLLVVGLLCTSAKRGWFVGRVGGSMRARCAAADALWQSPRCLYRDTRARLSPARHQAGGA